MTENFGKNLEIQKPKIDIGQRLREYGFSLLGGNIEKIPGDPKVGTLSIIKQIHNDYQEPDKLARENPEKYRELVRYQKAIYMELIRQKAQDIFIEGIRDMQLINGDWQKTAEKFKKLLKNPENREKIFSHYGGAIVYTVEHPHASLHHTEDPEILTEMSAYDREEFPPALIERREDYVIGQVQKFLEKNPGKKVAVIFGSSHDFRNNIKNAYPKYPPQTEIVSFPDIARKYLEKE